MSKKETKKKNIFVPVVSIIGIILLCAEIVINMTNYQTTTNAYIEGRLVQVYSRVSGSVVHLYTDNNQEVKKGDLLLEINSEHYQAKLKQAEAELRSVRAKLHIYEQNVKESISKLSGGIEGLGGQKSKFNFAKSDYDYYAREYDTDIISKQECEKIQINLASEDNINRAAVEHTGKTEQAGQSEEIKPEELLAEIRRLEALIKEIKLELSYTKVYAPQDGLVSAQNVKEGDYVEASQPLLSIIPKRVWVIANYNGNQITNMSVGQPVKIKIDKYSGRIFKGVVDNIQCEKPDYLPPQNSAESYTGIIQKVPVRIIFIEDYSEYNIVPGMPAVVSVKVK
ncbi:MAG: HlyD family secretion protein [Candidatus Gastranaerophilales bacterium]|nr:HlyD family secretion protein [Candidatus Gastranaerophilales bacterium]